MAYNTFSVHFILIKGCNSWKTSLHHLETARTLLHQESLSSNFWSFVFHHVSFLINQIPTTTLNHQFPFEIIFNKQPNYESHRIFGCLYYLWLRPYVQKRLELYSIPCVYIGFSITHQCHQCFDPKSSNVFLSRDVKFVENIFPFDNMFLP